MKDLINILFKVEVKLDLWGLQSRIEEYIQKAIREVLLVGHRQAFAWIDSWYNMTSKSLTSILFFGFNCHLWQPMNIHKHTSDFDILVISE